MGWWRKRTRVATNTCSAGARLPCHRAGHFRLHGFQQCAASLGRCPAECAKLTNCCRAGEASNTGPRAARPRNRLLDLEARPLYSETSLLLGQRAWTSFLSWCGHTLNYDPLPMSHSCPLPPAMALRAFGNYLYRSSGSLQVRDRCWAESSTELRSPKSSLRGWLLSMRPGGFLWSGSDR